MNETQPLLCRVFNLVVDTDKQLDNYTSGYKYYISYPRGGSRVSEFLGFEFQL